MTQPSPSLSPPALVPPDQLLAEYTARLPLLENLLGIIRGNQAGQPTQHALLVGACGMGKTMTLRAFAHRLAQDPGLSAAWQPVVFDEQNRRVGDLADFWLECLRQWEHSTHQTEGIADRLLDQPSTDLESSARREFLQRIAGSGRRALVLIDNLDDLLAAIRGPEALRRLRAFLKEDSRVLILGTASRHLKEVNEVDQPFHEVFRNIALEGLPPEEIQAWLLRLAEVHQQPKMTETLWNRKGTVRALHVLTGGSPRFVKPFYRLLAEGRPGDTRVVLERFVEEWTPYFKAILDAVPVKQRRIFDALALAWDPMGLPGLTTATRLPRNQVCTQLEALMQTGLVREAAGVGTRKFYQVAERFANIHYLMRHGRSARPRLDGFVALVCVLFPDEEAAEVQARAAHQATEGEKAGPMDAPSNEVSDTQTGSPTQAQPDLLKDPQSALARRAFLSESGHVAESWAAVLPALATQCIQGPGTDDLLGFTVDGFLRYARLATPVSARALLDSLPNPGPFQTLRDAFVLHGQRDHLHRLAPERQLIALELLDRLAQSLPPPVAAG